ncbi:hypothetical protein BgAZ_103050 [Babesia gibsoni]|uniref:6-Cys domain-containing protein n=1 Tax=Babesia gibsoni TaxID=33632 RepID=A0AAD8PFH1_BABGI|nr:hypothetical protein BgAZ_103050 [Babesia gibsoni]
MGISIWVVWLFSVFFCNAEVINWEELSIEELSIHDEDKRTVVINHIIRKEFAIRFTCPKPYVVYPRNDDEAAKTDPHVFVEAGLAILKVPLSRVIRGLHGKPSMRLFQDEERNGMELRYPGTIDPIDTGIVSFIRGDATRLHFFCALPNFDVGAYLAHKPNYLTISDSINLIPVRDDMINYLKEMGAAVGMLSIKISDIHKATHGCGSIETPEFINEVHHVKDTGVRSCTVDVMEHPDVGFYCDGRIEPNNCFYRLLDSETSDEINIDGFVDVKKSSDNKWFFATYNRQSFKTRFNGYCQCIDQSTGLVKAKINIMTGMSHECNISDLIFKDLTKPVIGRWCDVGLLPGDTLTIKLPVNIYDDDNNNPLTGYWGPIKSQPRLMTSYIYPHDMTRYFLNYWDLFNKIYPPHVHERKAYFVGDALQIDQSKQSDGIITVTYLENVPLSYPSWLSGLAYIWNLKVNKDVLAIREMTGIINIVPARTHDYYMLGCEPPNSSVFSKMTHYTANMSDMDIYGHKMRLCQLVPGYSGKYGLYCPPGQTVEPRGCDRYGFNASLHGTQHWKGLAMVYVNQLLSNMRFFKRTLMQRPPDNYSVICSCVDRDGFETARAIISNSTQQLCSYVGFGANRNMTLIVPSVKIIGGHIDGKLLPEIKEVPLIGEPIEKMNILSQGTSMRFWCELNISRSMLEILGLNDETEPFLVQAHQNISEEPLGGGGINKWSCMELSKYEALLLPLNSFKYFYRETNTGGQKKLVPEEYSNSFITNAGGFRVDRSMHSIGAYDYLSVTLMNPKSSIIVSKNNDAFVFLKYACGKLTRAHRLVEGKTEVGIYTEPYYFDDEEDIDFEDLDEHMSTDPPVRTNFANKVVHNYISSQGEDVIETRSLSVWGIIDVAIPATDPYLRGCGMTDPSEQLFRQDTIPLLNDFGERAGCEVDITEGDAAFYCPLPYLTEPRGCIPTSPTATFMVKQPGDKESQHFHVFTKDRRDFDSLKALEGEKRETFECHCVTNKGIKVATIRISA